MRLGPGVEIPDGALMWSQVRSGGPGGQNVNNTSSKVELRLEVIQITGLSIAAQDRFIALAGSRLTESGELILTCDETRSAGRNRDMLLERLLELVREARVVPKVRRATKPSRASDRRRLDGKSRTGEIKAQRRTPPAGD